jgi:hypothetical protein
MKRLETSRSKDWKPQDKNSGNFKIKRLETSR